MRMTVGITFIALFIWSEQLSATSPIPPRPYEVENPDHYIQMANAFCHHRLMDEWSIIGSDVGMALDSVVPIKVELSVPREYSPLGIKYTSQVVLKYRHDSLLEDASTWIDCQEYGAMIEYAERREVVSLFLEATGAIAGTYALRGSSHTFFYESEAGDTLEFVYLETETKDTMEYTGRFTFQHPTLLDNLETYLESWVPIQISEFMKNVGLCHARRAKGHLHVSSTFGPQQDTVCFSSTRARQPFTFKLPNSFMWSTFQPFGQAHMAVQASLNEETAPGCQIGRGSDSLFTILAIQPSGRAKRVYVMLRCDNGGKDVASVNVDTTHGIHPNLLLHTRKVLDSLDIRCP